MLKALLWDVDGTIADTERDGHRVAFNLAFRDAGLSWGWTESHYRSLLAVTGGRERILSDMDRWADAPRTTSAREELARRLHAAKNRHYAHLLAQGHVSARPGVLALMRQAHTEGLRQGIATTTSRSNVLALLTHLLGRHAQDMFVVQVCGEDTERKKPDPEVYHRAVAGLKLPVDQVLALEDSGPGVAAALAAGLPVCWRPGADSPALTTAVSPQVMVCDPDQPVALHQLQAWHRAWSYGRKRG